MSLCRAVAAAGLLAMLGGCIAPMTTGEAQGIARSRMVKYCSTRCGALTLVHSQQIKDRWLIDFDAPAHKFTVLVENDGNTQVSVWDKAREASGR